MVDSRAKGARTETLARDMLRKHSGLTWERVPGSGALDPKHQLKGDLYIPQHNNHYCVEVKGYAEDHLTSELLTSKNPQIIEWWRQTLRMQLSVQEFYVNSNNRRGQGSVAVGVGLVLVLAGLVVGVRVGRGGGGGDG